MLSSIFQLIILAAIWGGSFLFMRVAAPEFGPIPLIGIRVMIGMICLLPLLLLSKNFSAIKKDWKKMFFLGIINSAIPFSLYAYATLHLPAGFVSILNAMAPFFTALIGFIWFQQKLDKLQIMGIFLGFVGVIILVSDKASLQGLNSYSSLLAGLLAASFYGLAAHYTKKHFAQTSSVTLTTMGLMGSSAFLLVPMLFLFPTTFPSIKAWSMTLSLGVLCTGLAYVLFFRLIKRLGAMRAITVTFLIPVFGLLWGHLFLQESLTINMIWGVIIILLGLALTLKIKLKKT